MDFPIHLLRQMGDAFLWLLQSHGAMRVGVLGLLLLVAVGNLHFLKRVEAYRKKDRLAGDSPERPNAAADADAVGLLPFVSLLVPARNEEKNIEKCVVSLLQQDYPSFEVIVLDDDSTDATPAILQELAGAWSRLHVINGRPLPSGWLGKHWACQQLAQVARGELLLFTDADTWHHPQMLGDAVAAQRVEESDLLTGIPYEETGTWGEALVIPIISWAMFSLIPWDLAHRSKSPSLSMGIGQFMLFTRSAYAALGGFEAVRTDPVDDVALTRRTKELGLRWRFVDLTRRVKCRMYSGFKEMADGLGKTIYPVLRCNPWVLAIGAIALTWLYLAPVVVGVGWLLGFSPRVDSPAWAGVAICLAFVEWVLVLGRAGHPWYRAVFYPLTIALTIGIGVRSALLFRRGQARWKGRTLPALRRDRPPADVPDEDELRADDELHAEERPPR